MVRGKYRKQMEIFACYRVAIYCAVWNNQIYCDVVECVSIMRENTMQTLRLALIFTQYTHSWCATCSLSFTYIHHWYVDIYIYSSVVRVWLARVADSRQQFVWYPSVHNQKSGRQKEMKWWCLQEKSVFLYVLWWLSMECIYMRDSDIEARRIDINKMEGMHHHTISIHTVKVAMHKPEMPFNEMQNKKSTGIAVALTVAV